MAANAPRRALITGASSGIGAAFAARLAQDGYDLLLVARRRDRLDQLAAKLRSQTGVQAEAIEADLTNRGDLGRLEGRISEDEYLEMLVNNAGFGVYKTVLDTDPGDLEEMILLNVVITTRLARVAVERMVSRGRGTIINVASSLPFLASAGRVGYSATKAYLINFTRGLNDEVQGKGVRLQALCPGITLTEFHNRSGTDISKIPSETIMPPEIVADASLAGLEMGELICLPGLDDPRDLLQYEEARSHLASKLGRKGQAADRYRLP